jgi:thiol-disulfide isomerase/thioredoxin
MLRRCMFAITMLAWISMPGPVNADALEPVVYVFGAEQCGYCERAVKFLRRLHAEKGRFTLHEYDIVASSDDATLYVKVVAAIGLTDPVIPMVIVGREVLLGFESDEASGREIQRNIERCHIAECPDLLRPLIEPTDAVSTVATGSWIVHRRWAEAALRR